MRCRAANKKKGGDRHPSFYSVPVVLVSSVLAALAPRFRGMLAILGKLAAAIATTTVVLLAGGVLLPVLVLVLVALLASLHMLLMSTALGHRSSPFFFQGEPLRASRKTNTPARSAVPSRNIS